MTTADQALIVRDLEKAYGDQQVVRGVTLEIPPGTIVALLGPNGAGKSTTMKMCAGFIEVDSGEVLIDGVDALEDRDAARSRFTYLPENVVLYDELSGRENLIHLLRIATGEKADRATTDEALLQVGLPETALDRRAETYSKGMRQKLGLALTLAKDARLLLLDEPTSGLDPHSAAEFNAALRTLAERGVGVLMATHDIWRAREVANRLLIMVDGRIAQDLDPEGMSAEEIERRFFLEAEPGHAA